MYFLSTVKHLISAASKYGDFNRVKHWRGIILAVTQFNTLKKFSIPIGATFKGMIMGSIFFSLIVGPFQTWFHTLLFKFWFINTHANIL